MDDKEEACRLICEQKIIKNRSYSREEAIIGIFPLLGRYEEVSANGGLSRYAEDIEVVRMRLKGRTSLSEIP